MIFMLGVMGTEPESCVPPPVDQSGAPNTADATVANDDALALRNANPPPDPAFLDLNALPPPICTSLIESAPRGLACLHCTQPEAANQADTIAMMIAETCLKNVAINYLVDGSFSFNPELINRHIALLSSGGRKLFIEFYLLNGPAQRRYRGNHGAGFATGISPAEFRERIISDDTLRTEFQDHVRRLIPVLRFAAEHGAVIQIVPMLEDNLTEDSFKALSELTLSALPSDMTVALGRNPCGCSNGSDKRIPPGHFEETHSLRSAGDVPNGVVTNDGDPDELSDLDGRGRISISELITARDRAAGRNATFILWGARRQGFQLGDDGSLKRVSPEERSYEVPSPTQSERIVRFLRGELP